ncbi:DUF308 domain-containing protein [Chloroflexota bacterium]
MTVPSDGIKKPRGKYWWITLARGVFALALGLGLFLPFVDSQSSLLNFMAMYWLFSGISSISWGFRGARRKGVWLVAGLLGITGGSLILLRPQTAPIIAPEVFPIMLGVIAVLTGLVHVFGGFQSRHSKEREWTLSSFLLGITEIGLGVLILATLEDPHRALIWLAAAWATVGGVGLILISIGQRRQYLGHFIDDEADR